MKRSLAARQTSARRGKSMIPLRIGIQCMARLPRRRVHRRTFNRRTLFRVVSTRSTLSCLSYIFIEFSSIQCLIRIPSARARMPAPA